MCPYCGEEVPQDSSKCWKCGTELSEGGARAEGGELEVPDDEEDEEGAAPASVIECPFCGSAVSKKWLRCRECGRTLQKVKTNATAVALWKWGAWASVLVVALSTATVVYMNSRKRAIQDDRLHNQIPATYEGLMQRLQPLNKGYREERRREIWEKDFEKKVVNW